jgi:rubrerythrin
VCSSDLSIEDELKAINKYQRYMNEACHPEVKTLFCHIMNEEKEHVAEFTKALFCLTHEPLPPEHD